MKKNGSTIENKIVEKEMSTDLDDHYLSDTSTENDSKPSSSTLKKIPKSSVGMLQTPVQQKITKEPNPKKRRQNQRINEQKDKEMHPTTEDPPHTEPEQEVTNLPVKKPKKELSEAKKAALAKANRARLYKKWEKEYVSQNKSTPEPKIPTEPKIPMAQPSATEAHHPPWMDHFFHRLSETLQPVVAQPKQSSSALAQPKIEEAVPAQTETQSRPSVFQPLITRPYNGPRPLIY